MASFPRNNQQQLDSTQYTAASILDYEQVFGKDFVSPGGYDMAVELIGTMQLQENAHVLDIGCGVGGSAFVMAREFGARVDGIDLSQNMLAQATSRLNKNGLAEFVSLELGDCLDIERPGIYDAIYSRDVFLHIQDKSRLFSVLFESLRPGGSLLFTDYCCAEQPWQDDFTKYVAHRGYHLRTLAQYASLLSDAGFIQVETRDMSDRFVALLQRDLETIQNIDCDEATRNSLALSWQGKLARANSGDHRWGLVTAGVPT
jgi:phosphoethanolamine N-methyltransferase